jgi:hypothetical protein
MVQVTERQSSLRFARIHQGLSCVARTHGGQLL